MERATVLIVRAWTEVGPPPRLKVRMITAPSEERPGIVVGVTTNVDDACGLLRGWLVSLGLADDTTPPAQPGRGTA